MTRKVKVLHIITRLIKGGADENTMITVKGLSKKEFEIDLMIGAESDWDISGELSGVNVIKNSMLIRNIHPLKDLLAFIKIMSLCLRKKYDIVHTHTAKAGILGRFAAYLCGGRIIIHTLHGSTFHNSAGPLAKNVYIFLERLAFKVTHKMIVVGTDLRDRYIASKIGRKKDYIVIRSGFDLDRFLLSKQTIQNYRIQTCHQWGIDKYSFVFGSVSRLEDRKGHIYLLKAISPLLQQYPNTYLVIAGEGAQKHFLMQFAKSHGISEKVMFTGYRSDIEKVISAFDVFVLTSLWEGLPRVLVQASALAKPIVTFDVEGAKEIVENNSNGFIVALKDVEGLKNRLLYFLNSPNDADNMGQKGRGKVSSDWHRDVMVQNIRDLYYDLLDRQCYS